MRMTDTTPRDLSMARRRLLAWVGWGSFAAFWGTITLATVRFFFPRILYEPSPQFHAGKPEDYQVVEVDEHLKKSQRVRICTQAEGARGPALTLLCALLAGVMSTVFSALSVSKRAQQEIASPQSVNPN